MNLKSMTIHPVTYRGSFQILTSRPPHQPSWGPFCGAFGRIECWVPVDRHWLTISHGVNFPFDMRADGTIDCLGSHALHSAGSTIKLAPVTIEIDRGTYPGPIRIEGVDADYVNGALVRNVLPGLVSNDPQAGYILAFGPGNSIRFNVDAAGNVSLSSCYSAAGTWRGNKLSLATVAVHIDPGGYAGNWNIVGAESQPRPGERQVTLVPHARGFFIKLAPKVGKSFDLLHDGTPVRDKLEIEHQGTTHTFRLSKA